MNCTWSPPLPAMLPLPHLISQRVAGHNASAVAAHWEVAQLAPLQQALDAQIDVEPLSLEDIFVEFHL